MKKDLEYGIYLENTGDTTLKSGKQGSYMIRFYFKTSLWASMLRMVRKMLSLDE